MLLILTLLIDTFVYVAKEPRNLKKAKLYTSHNFSSFPAEMLF